jgi:hypothetical protein
MFDPWTADFETAKLAQESCGLDVADPNGPLYQAAAVKSIEAEKPAIDAGDGFAVLACIRRCVTHGLVAPEWLAYAFDRRYDAVLNCRAGSWDSLLAFGKPYPVGTHLNALRKARLNRVKVRLDVTDILQREPETPIDKGLFERVGKSLGLGATLTEEFYYQAKRMFEFKRAAKNTAKRKKSAGILRKHR